jgi:hypothetical protein
MSSREKQAGLSLAHRVGMRNFHAGVTSSFFFLTQTGKNAMKPRGQLWFALENICRDFRNYSGLTEREALEVLVIVLTNMLDEQQADLEQLSSIQPTDDELGLVKLTQLIK